MIIIKHQGAWLEICIIERLGAQFDTANVIEHKGAWLQISILVKHKGAWLELRI